MIPHLGHLLTFGGSCGICAARDRCIIIRHLASRLLVVPEAIQAQGPVWHVAFFSLLWRFSSIIFF